MRCLSSICVQSPAFEGLKGTSRALLTAPAPAPAYAGIGDRITRVARVSRPLLHERTAHASGPLRSHLAGWHHTTYCGAPFTLGSRPVYLVTSHIEYPSGVSTETRVGLQSLGARLCMGAVKQSKQSLQDPGRGPSNNDGSCREGHVMPSIPSRRTGSR